MEQMNSNIEVKEAYLVTMDTIVPVQAFSMLVASTYGATESVYYAVEKGWKLASMWGNYKEIAWTSDEATELQIQKKKDHLEYLQKEQEKNASKIAEIIKDLGQ